MDIGFLMPPSGSPAAQTNSGVSSETDQSQESTQCGAFSVVFEDVGMNTLDEKSSLLSVTDPIEPVLAKTMEDAATGAALIGIAVASLLQSANLPGAVSPVTSESIPSPPPGVKAPQDAVSQGDISAAVQGATTTSSEGREPNTLLPQGSTEAVPDGDSIVGKVFVPVGLLQADTADSSPNRLLPPALVPAQSNEPSTTQGDSRSTGQSAIRNGGGAPSNGAPPLLEQPSVDALLLNAQPLDSPTSDRREAVVINEQWSRNLSPAGYVHGVIQLPGRPSIEGGPSAMLQAQGSQETMLPGQALVVSMAGSSGEGGQDPFGASAQGRGEGTLFQFTVGGVPESMVRGAQFQFFSDQFTLAQQAQPSSQGAGSPAALPLQNQLKLAQAFIGGNQTTSMTPVPGMAQTVHMVLPSHDSGPLSVRISVTDQTVSTQFTTDRGDLGQVLLTRQDQLQQNLSRSGLELGQFQVHINQEGRQEAFPDRQSRRNGEAPDRQLASQDQGRQSHDRERPHDRPSRTLSLFA